MPTDRRIGGPHLARMLGEWRAGTPSSSAYAGLAARVRLLILDGRLPLHTRVPAEREVAAALDISRTTAAAAYELLRGEGFLASRRGSGTWTRLPTAPVPAVGGLASYDDGTTAGLLDLAHAAPSAPATWLHAAAQDAVTQLTRHLPSHGYDAVGLPSLRAAVADRYAARGLPTDPGQVLVTGGAQHAFALALRAFARPGDRIVVEHPTYPNALEAIRSAGCRPVPVGFPAQGWDLEMLAATFRHAAPTLAYLTADFQNPTGRCMTPTQRAAVVELACRTGTTLVVDETVAELSLDGPAPEPVASFGGEAGTVVTTGSTSKTFWGGLRIGWVRAAPAAIRRLAAARASFDLASPVLEQLVAAALVPRTPEMVAERRPVLTAGRDRMVARLAAALPSWRVEVPPGGLALWVDLGAPLSSALTIAAERHGVALAAGPRFGVDGAFERYVRVPYTLDADDLDLAVDRLAAAFGSLGVDAPTEAPDRTLA